MQLAAASTPLTRLWQQNPLQTPISTTIPPIYATLIDREIGLGTY